MFLNSESSELSIKMQTGSLLSKQLGIEESEMPLKVKLVVSSLLDFAINCDLQRDYYTSRNFEFPE